MRAMIASGIVPERDRRQDEVPERVDRHVELAADDAGRDVQAGDEVEDAARQALAAG